MLLSILAGKMRKLHIALGLQNWRRREGGEESMQINITQSFLILPQTTNYPHGVIPHIVLLFVIKALSELSESVIEKSHTEYEYI